MVTKLNAEEWGLGFRKEKENPHLCFGASELMDSVETQREKEGGTACQSKYGKIRIQINEDKTLSV